MTNHKEKYLQKKNKVEKQSVIFSEKETVYDELFCGKNNAKSMTTENYHVFWYHVTYEKKELKKTNLCDV